MRFANRNNQHNIISHSVAIHFSYYFGVDLEKKKFVINSIYNLQESARPTLKRRKRMYTSIRRIGAMMGTHKHVHWMNIIFQYVGNKRLKCWWWWWRLTATLTAAAKCTQSWIGTRLRLLEGAKFNVNGCKDACASVWERQRNRYTVQETIWFICFHLINQGDQNRCCWLNLSYMYTKIIRFHLARFSQSLTPLHPRSVTC